MSHNKHYFNEAAEGLSLCEFYPSSVTIGNIKYFTLKVHIILGKGGICCITDATFQWDIRVLDINCIFQRQECG